MNCQVDKQNRDSGTVVHVRFRIVCYVVMQRMVGCSVESPIAQIQTSHRAHRAKGRCQQRYDKLPAYWYGLEYRGIPKLFVMIQLALWMPGEKDLTLDKKRVVWGRFQWKDPLSELVHNDQRRLRRRGGMEDCKEF